jgi:ABC-type lipoprotein release transport system permease subunit
MFKYAIKRVLRGYKLFIALTIGVVIATTFFSSMIVSADVMTKEALLDALEDLDYDARVSANNITWSNQNFTDLKALIEDMPDVVSADVYSKYTYNRNASRGETFDVVGADPQSTLWNTFEHINGSVSLAANETWVVASSTNASLLSAGEIIQTSIPVQTTEFPYFSFVEINLTIAGFIDIPMQTARLLNPAQVIDLGFIQIEIGDWRTYDLLIVDWESTIRPVIQWFDQQKNVSSMVMSSGFLCRLDRDILVNPYDVGASAANIADTLARVEDRTAHFNTQVANLIGSTLQMLSFMSGILILAFVSLAAPIIFMSWYSSTMLSDVSYNLRRREFGLLQTKGFGPKTIKRMLMFEGAIIGLIGGVTGLFFGTTIAHLILDVSMETPFVALSANPINTAVIIGFGLVIALWSVRGPADRAAKLETGPSRQSQAVYLHRRAARIQESLASDSSPIGDLQDCCVDLGNQHADPARYCHELWFHCSYCDFALDPHRCPSQFHRTNTVSVWPDEDTVERLPEVSEICSSCWWEILWAFWSIGNSQCPTESCTKCGTRLYCGPHCILWCIQRRQLICGAG